MEKFDSVLAILQAQFELQSVIEDMVKEGLEGHSSYQGLCTELQELKEQTPMMRCVCGVWVPRSLYLPGKKAGCYLCKGIEISSEQKMRYAMLIKPLMRNQQ